MTDPDKPTPRCETCPFWQRIAAPHDSDGVRGYCHNVAWLQVPDNNSPVKANYWCSEHPDAPPTRMERVLVDVNNSLVQLAVQINARS